MDSNSTVFFDEEPVTPPKQRYSRAQEFLAVSWSKQILEEAWDSEAERVFLFFLTFPCLVLRCPMSPFNALLCFLFCVLCLCFVLCLCCPGSHECAWSSFCAFLGEQRVEVEDSANAPNGEKREDSLTLERCFEMYTSEEVLNPEDSWLCPNCKEFVEASKKMELWTSPDVLVIHLKRFSYTRSADLTLVPFFLRALKLASWALAANPSISAGTSGTTATSSTPTSSTPSRGWT